MSGDSWSKPWRKSDINNLWWAVNQTGSRWQSHALNTSVASKMYRQGSTLISDSKRQHVSPLGGVATVTSTEERK